MQQEIDLESLIYNMRVLKMIIRAVTKKRQRKAVQYFKRFVVNDDKEVEQDMVSHNMTAEQLIDGFDALSDNYDKRILYEITGRKLNQEDYWDDSD